MCLDTLNALNFKWDFASHILLIFFFSRVCRPVVQNLILHLMEFISNLQILLWSLSVVMIETFPHGKRLLCLCLKSCSKREKSTDWSKHAHCLFLTRQSDLSLLPRGGNLVWYVDQCPSPWKYKEEEWTINTINSKTRKMYECLHMLSNNWLVLQ